MFCDCWAAGWASFGVSVGGGGAVRARLGLRGQSATLLEITCHGSRFYYPILLYICALEIFAVKTFYRDITY